MLDFQDNIYFSNFGSRCFWAWDWTCTSQLACHPLIQQLLEELLVCNFQTHLHRHELAMSLLDIYWKLCTDAGSTVDVLVRRRNTETPLEVRVAVIGNVDSGKSTLTGVLTRATLDDGRGSARSKVFKHSHEESTGRTSSIGQHNLCVCPCLMPTYTHISHSHHCTCKVWSPHNTSRFLRPLASVWSVGSSCAFWHGQ